MRDGRASTTEEAIPIVDPGRVVTSWQMAELLPVEVHEGVSAWKDGRIEDGLKALVRGPEPCPGEVRARLKVRPDQDTDLALYHDILADRGRRRAYLPSYSPETKWARSAHLHLGTTEGGTTMATEISIELDSWGLYDLGARRENAGYIRSIDLAAMSYRARVEGIRHDERMNK